MKDRGSYIKIIGVWGRVYGVFIPGIVLVAGKFGREKFFASILMVQNAIFLFFRNYGRIV